MGVKKKYSLSDVEAAIETANKQYFKQLLRVRSDVSNEDFGKSSLPADPANPYAYRGAGSDVGHSFRHVEGTAPEGKSTYDSNATMYKVVRHLLNSEPGQRQLGALDGANPTGDERGIKADGSALTETISGSVSGLNLYGYDQSGAKKKIKRAMCIVQKLGADVLWVHTNYPTSFVE